MSHAASDAAMIFNSYQFLFGFLPAVLAGTFLLARLGPGAAQCWLIGASLTFYAFWNPAYLPLLLGSIGFNYLVAIRMARSGDAAARSRLLGLAVAGDLGLLAYYKYTGYFLENVNLLTGTTYEWRSLILPLGISFYTFQQLTLLADISSGRIKDFRLSDFVLFVTFFPHLIAGPIVHHREMMPQFRTADYRLNWENLAVGLVLLAIGLFKKVVLADGIAEHVAPIFALADAGKPVSAIYAWGASAGFTLQMYFDFSGYSEMALGLARMAGIRLPMNFNSPLKALSIVEYWSRWHITLTRFLTAYVYSPIAIAAARRRAATGKPGVAGSPVAWGAFGAIVAVPTMVTMFLSGLWHGAGNQFLLFGTLHGTALVINHAWRLLRHNTRRALPASRWATRPIAWLMTFLVVMVALTWFHAVSVASGWNIVAGLVGAHGWLPIPPGRSDAAQSGNGMSELILVYGWVALLMGIAILAPNTLQLLREWRPAITMPAVSAPVSGSHAERLKLLLSPVWACATGALMVAGILGVNRVSEFLYWKF